MIDTILSQEEFHPLPKLRTKYIVQLFFIWAAILIFPLILMTILAITGEEPVDALIRVGTWIVGISGVLVLIIIPFIHWYYESITYEIMNDEVHVYRGIVTKTRKIVPYRTITNLDIKQGPFDRVFGLGTIEIQTAGNSAQKTGPEERIDGLPGHLVADVQEILVNRVRRMRGSPATSHDVDDEETILESILYEIRLLREHLTK